MSEKNIQMLELMNESEADITVTIEPHLLQYELPARKGVKIFHCFEIDNSSPDDTLTIACLPEEILVFCPWLEPPRLEVDGKTIEPL